MKKDKKAKPWTLNFIKEGWICRTGAIFQRFSVKRKQAQSEREGESRARGGVKKKKTTKKTPVPLCTPKYKNILRIVNS